MEFTTYEIIATTETENLDDVVVTNNGKVQKALYPKLVRKAYIAEAFWELFFEDAWEYPEQGTVFIRQEGEPEWEKYFIKVETSPKFTASKV